MKKIYILILSAILPMLNTLGQSGKWTLHIDFSLLNVESYTSGSKSFLETELSINNGGYSLEWSATSQVSGIGGGKWAYISYGKDYNLTQKLTGIRLYSKLEHNNGGDPGNDQKHEVTCNSHSSSGLLGYKLVHYCDMESCKPNNYTWLYRGWSGYMDVYVYPKDVVIAYKSGTSLILPSSDKVKIEAITGYEPDVYKWVYSDDNGITWRPFSNTSLQEKNVAEFSGEDVYGSNYLTDMTIGSNTLIALEYYVYKDKSNPKVIEHSNYIALTNLRSAPNIVKIDSVDIMCFGNSNGKIKVKLSRPLISGEILKIYYTNALNPIEITSLDSDNSFEIDNLSAGTYTVQISGSCNGVQMYSDGADHKKNVTVNSPPLLAYSLSSSTNISCYGGSDGSLKISASGGTPPYKVYWKKQGETSYISSSFTSASETIISNLAPGTYEFYVSDANDCELRDVGGALKIISATLTQPSKALDFGLFGEPVAPSGYGLSNGSIAITGDGGTPDASGYYTVVWKNKTSGATISTVTNETVNGKFRSTLHSVPAGIYTVTVIDSNGCSITLEFGLAQPLPLSVAIENSSPILCNGDANGELVAHASGGVLQNGQKYSYEWFKQNGGNYSSTGQTDSIASGLSAGIYKVVVKDEASPKNSVEKEFALTEPSPVTTVLSIRNVSCYGGSNGYIKIKTSGGTAGYTLFYKEKNDEDYSSMAVNQSDNTFLLDNLPKSEYRLYITDANGCYADISGSNLAIVNITQPDNAVEIISTAQTPPSGYGLSNGSIQIKVVGGTPKSAAPAYDLIWKDEQGNTLSSAYSYDENGIFTSKIYDLKAGTYTVEIRDNNYTGGADACFLIASFTLDEPEPLAVSVEITGNILCNGDANGELTAHAKGGVPDMGGNLPYTYNWYKVENGNESLIANQNDSILKNLPTGSYKVKVEDASIPPNAVESQIINITQPDTLSTTLTLRNIYCYGQNDGFIRILVSGGVGGYKLFCKKENEDADFKEFSANESDSTFFLNNLYAGKYTLYLIDANNCRAKINGEETCKITLTQPDAPLQITASEQLDVSGFGRSDGKIEITIEGGTANADSAYNVVWKNASGQVIQAGSGFKNGKFISFIENLSKGEYFVEITDRNYAGAYQGTTSSCIVTALYAIIEPEKLEVEIEETHFISCNGMSDGQLTAHAKGGVRNSDSGLPYKYQWYKEENGNYTAIPNAADSILQNVPTGNYRIDIEDYSRIVNTTFVSYFITQPDILTASATEKMIFCGQTAEVSVEVSGGTPPYSYEWSTGDNTPALSNAGAGKYLVFIADSRGCQTTALAKISTPSDLDVTGTATNPVCYGTATGNIVLQVTGGTAPYSYKWNNGATTKDRQNLATGAYTVTVTDAQGCSFTEGYILKDPEPLRVNVGEDRTLCDGQSFTIAPEVSIPDVRFSWSSSNGFTSAEPQVTVSKAGTYRLTVTDGKGCQASDEMEVKISNSEISSEIVVSTEVFVGDTIVIVNISNPEPEKAEWIIKETDSIRIVEYDEYYAKVIFSKQGNYRIGFRTYVGECYQDVFKTINVVEAGIRQDDSFGESVIKQFSIYPNPNDGNFHAKVELNKTANIRLRIINIGNGQNISDAIYNGQEEYDLPYNLSASSGVYVVILETASGYMNIKIVIK
jgi:uncharacterized protein (DUF2141 family)